MEWKFCANAGFFGLRRDRFTQYQPARTLAEKLELIAGIDCVTGVELKYPVDFHDPRTTASLLDGNGLELSAVSVDIKDAAHFRFGALSASAPDARARAVGLLKEGMDAAAEFGAGRVTTCSLADGFDYAFQVDHTAAWVRLVESAREAAGHRADVNLLFEYQKHEPHAHIMLDTVGKLLHLIAEAGAVNMGATPSPQMSRRLNQHPSSPRRTGLDTFILMTIPVMGVIGTCFQAPLTFGNGWSFCIHCGGWGTTAGSVPMFPQSRCRRRRPTVRTS
jgi:hypothetical protein